MTLEELRKVPLTELPGIGSYRAELFSRQNVQTAGDLLDYFPRDYVDERQRTMIAQAPFGEDVIIRARLLSAPRNFHKGKLTITSARIEDESGSLPVVWFNQPYMVKNLMAGGVYLFEGKVQRKANRVSLSSPKVQKASPDMPGILPVYPLGSGLTQKVVRLAVSQALKLYTGQEDMLPPAYRQNMLSEREAYEQMHHPSSFEEQEKARDRLVFDELFIQQLALRRLKRSHDAEKTGAVLEGDPQKEKVFLDSLPYELTASQKQVLSEVGKDLKSTRPMNRLIQGDVGSGKTILAFFAMYRAFLSGFQSALMVPTEVLAAQHFASAEKLLSPFGMHVELLTGSVKGRDRKAVLCGLADGSVDAVIGTHALLSDPVAFKNLGLVITDEQHRFGVRQRLALSQKSSQPNILVMTATPIPRTLAMILFGDMDISVLRELPPGRMPVKTYQVDRSYDERLYAFMRKQAEAGHQVYVICAAVEDRPDEPPADEEEEEDLYLSRVEQMRLSEKEKLDLRSAVSYASFLQQQVFPDLSVGLLHGQMKNREKEKVMSAFAKGKIQILVSTTVVEVGVNVPNATLMVVENAERFGLSQLHQLRGRVGRGREASYCVLVTDSRQKLTRERLSILVDSNDGFHIAEEDLRLRGSGDVFGLRQHGLPDFKLADLYRDTDILYQAQMLSQTVMEADPDLVQLEHRGIRLELDAFWDKAVIGS